MNLIVDKTEKKMLQEAAQAYLEKKTNELTRSVATGGANLLVVAETVTAINNLKKRIDGLRDYNDYDR